MSLNDEERKTMVGLEYNRAVKLLDETEKIAEMGKSVILLKTLANDLINSYHHPHTHSISTTGVRIYFVSLFQRAKCVGGQT